MSSFKQHHTTYCEIPDCAQQIDLMTEKIHT